MRPAFLLLFLAIACNKPAQRFDTGSPSVNPHGGGAGGGGSDAGADVEGGSSSCGEAAIVDTSKAGARVFFVAPDGNDSRDGSTRGTAWRSFANLATKLEPGDRVDVVGGNYACGGRITVKGTASAPVWIRSVDGPRKAILDCSGLESGFEVFRASYVVIEGFEMRSAARDLIRVHSGVSPFTEISDHIVLLSNHLFSSGQSGIRVEQSSNVDVAGNDIHDTEALGPSALGQGIDLVGVSNARILGNVVHGILANTGIQIRGGSTAVLAAANIVYDVGEGFSFGGTSDRFEFRPSDATHEARTVMAHSNQILFGVQTPVATRGCEGCTLANNTIAVTGAVQLVRALAGASSSGGISHTSGLRFFNNIVHVSRSSPQRLFDVAAAESSGFEQKTNLFFVDGGSAGAVPSDIAIAGAAGTVVDRDPRFVDLAKGDLRLLADSPALGAGTTLSDVRYDASFNCRTRFNIGAY
jgi:hypothetical protein